MSFAKEKMQAKSYYTFISLKIILPALKGTKKIKIISEKEHISLKLQKLLRTNTIHNFINVKNSYTPTRITQNEQLICKQMNK